MTQSLTGLWYNDSYRLAAMLAVTGVPLAALGLSAIVSAVASRWKVKELVAGLAAVSLFYISTGGGYATPRERTVAGNYHRLPDEVIVVSEIEQEFFKTVGTIVPQGQVVAGNPWNGSSMLYPVAGTRVLFHHIKGHWSDDQLLVAEHLIDAEQRPEVCAAVHRLQVAYLITGGDGFWDWSPESKLYPGLEEPGVRPGFVLATAHGPHKLYRLTACDLGRQNY